MNSCSRSTFTFSKACEVFLHRLRNSTGSKGTPLEYCRLCETLFQNFLSHKSVPNSPILWHFEVLLLFLSLRYGADLGRSRLVCWFIVTECMSFSTVLVWTSFHCRYQGTWYAVMLMWLMGSIYLRIPVADNPLPPPVQVPLRRLDVVMSPFVPRKSCFFVVDASGIQGVEWMIRDPFFLTTDCKRESKRPLCHYILKHFVGFSIGLLKQLVSSLRELPI